jgi:hypothetical protein
LWRRFAQDDTLLFLVGFVVDVSEGQMQVLRLRAGGTRSSLEISVAALRDSARLKPCPFKTAEFFRKLCVVP